MTLRTLENYATDSGSKDDNSTKNGKSEGIQGSYTWWDSRAPSSTSPAINNE